MRLPVKLGDKVPPKRGDRAMSRGRNTKGTAQEVILNLIVPISFVNPLGVPGSSHPVCRENPQ